jgi:hypothetical protein
MLALGRRHDRPCRQPEVVAGEREGRQRQTEGERHAPEPEADEQESTSHALTVAPVG